MSGSEVRVLVRPKQKLCPTSLLSVSEQSGANWDLSEIVAPYITDAGVPRGAAARRRMISTPNREPERRAILRRVLDPQNVSVNVWRIVVWCASVLAKLSFNPKFGPCGSKALEPRL